MLLLFWRKKESARTSPGNSRADYPYERVIDVVATMEYRKAHGRCDNPGGFIREALIKQWQTPKAVVDARRRAEAKLRQQAADEQARRAGPRNRRASRRRRATRRAGSSGSSQGSTTRNWRSWPSRC